MNSESQNTEMSEEREVQPTEAGLLNLPEQNYNSTAMNRVIHYRFNKEKYAVSCSPFMTVLKALQRSRRFRGMQLKNNDKDLVIQREKFPKAVVNTDFPCILIDEQEILEISFIKAGPSSTTPGHWYTTRHEDLVSFNIRTKGGKNIRQIMRNQELKLEFDFVCVHAKRGECLKKALKRDGRFSEVIFTKHCALIEIETEVITEKSTLVDHLDGKHLQVIRYDDVDPLVNIKKPGSQKVSRMRNNVSDATPSCSQVVNASPEYRKPTRPGFLKTTDLSAVFQTWKKVPQSEALFTTLSEQCRHLLNKLKKQRKQKSSKKVIRVEYDKGVQSFSKIRDLKKLMGFSDSVCMIVVDEEPNGTGFVLFERFVLTCAHVVTDPETKPIPQKLQAAVTAEFHYEDSRNKQVYQVKEDIVCCSYKVEGDGAFLDFALLELGEMIPQTQESVNPAEADTSTPPAVLQQSISLTSTQVTKGICIIGHPDCRVKKMDICCIIPDEEWERTTNERLTKIPEKTLHVISELSLFDDWNYNRSQISYDSCFFHGASGSPLFNKHCQLIGIHTGGYVYEDEKDERERSLMEYAFPIGPVIQRIRKHLEDTGRRDELELLNSMCSVQGTVGFSETIPVFPVINKVLKKREDTTEKMASMHLS